MEALLVLRPTKAQRGVQPIPDGGAEPHGAGQDAEAGTPERTVERQQDPYDQIHAAVVHPEESAGAVSSRGQFVLSVYRGAELVPGDQCVWEGGGDDPGAVCAGRDGD